MAIDRPEVLEIVTHSVQRNSRLLADLLLFPPMSVLACVIIAQWSIHSSGWDRELVERDYRQNQVTAFTDAVEIMGYFLQLGEVNPAEAGSLLVWIYEHNTPSYIGNQGREYFDKMLASFRECLFKQPQAVLEKMYASLVEEEDKLGLGKPTFAAAIDCVSIGGLENIVNPDHIVRSYIQAVQAGDYALSAHKISQTGAVSLVKLAQRSGDQWTTFLASMDTYQLLASAREPGNNEFLIKDAISRSLRSHIRILCRAIAVWGEIPPDDLVLALNKIIKLGACAHEEKGKVSAFSAKYEDNHFTDLTEQPIANDLAAALRALQGESHQALLEAILNIDEPLTLAQLLTLVPTSCRAKIEERLGELSPNEAGQVWSLMAVQSRIDALLTAGVESPVAASLAAEYIKFEGGLKTLGSVPGLELERLQANLRLNFLQHDWETIAQMEYPSDPHMNLGAACDSIDFYKGIAELQKPGGNPHVAVLNFQKLCSKHPDISAYVNNLFAARISVLLKNDPFCLLIGKKAAQGREALSEAQLMVSNLPWQSRDDQALYGVNKALLLLALGQARTAYDTLFAIHSERSQDSVTAYTAVALFRTGEQEKALDMLKHAQTTKQGVKVIEAALAHVKGRAVINFPVDLLSVALPVLDMDEIATREPDTQALEQILIGDMMTIAGEANQIFRPITMFDYGIDGEVEFKDNDGKASGKKIYVQLKSGNSYLRERKSDGNEIFDVKNERHLEYWSNQPVDVYLVIRQQDERSGDTAIRWMNITRYLKERKDKPNRQIVFSGEKLDAPAVWRVRDRFFRR